MVDKPCLAQQSRPSRYLRRIDAPEQNLCDPAAKRRQVEQPRTIFLYQRRPRGHRFRRRRPYNSCADAVKLSFGASTAPAASSSIIDNGSSQCSSSGPWLVSSGPNPYGKNSLYGETAGGSYTFNSSNTGRLVVSLWWTSLGTRSTRVPVDIYDGSTRLNRVYVNQQQNGGKWNSLGQYSFTRGARVVIVSEGGGNNSCADAVKLQAN